MPRVTKLLGRRVGPLGIALTAYDIWRRLPESQRRRLLEQGRKHGPRIAAEAVRRGARLGKRR